MIDNDGNYVCDFCRGASGEFSMITGNHVSCEEIERLNKDINQMYRDRERDVAELQSNIVEQKETIIRYQSLMNKHIVGKCPQCNYMASWPVCTKCGTPYPDGINELGEK